MFVYEKCMPLGIPLSYPANILSHGLALKKRLLNELCELPSRWIVANGTSINASSIITSLIPSVYI